MHLNCGEKYTIYLGVINVTHLIVCPFRRGDSIECHTISLETRYFASLDFLFRKQLTTIHVDHKLWNKLAEKLAGFGDASSIPKRIWINCFMKINRPSFIFMCYRPTSFYLAFLFALKSCPGRDEIGNQVLAVVCRLNEWIAIYCQHSLIHTYNQAVEAAFVCISYTYVSFQSIPRNHSSCRMCVCYVHRHVWRCPVIKYVFTQVRPYTDEWICWNSAPSFTNVKDIVQSRTPL